MSSGLWGAVAGLGKGVSENAVTNIKQTNELAQIDYRAMKEAALADVQGKIQAANQSALVKEQDAARQGQIVKEGDVSAANDLTKDTRASAESKLQRENEIKLQELRNKGSLDAADRNSRGRSRKVVNRFTFETRTGGEDTQFRPESILRDAGSNRVYKLEGDKYTVLGFQEDPKKPTPPPSDASYKELASDIAKGDEEAVSQFADKYHFLPAAAIRSLPKFIEGPSTSEYDSSTTDSE